MKAKKVLAWHWTDGRELRDGQPLVVGKLYKHDGPLVMCESGYHASVDIVDALGYAPGFTVSRVECSGEIESQDDKMVCTRRKVLWTVNARRAVLAWSVRVATDTVKAVKKVYKDKAWNVWADLWISGKDRTAAAANAAYAAHYAAAAGYAGYAAANAGYAAANAADAAYAAANAAHAAHAAAAANAAYAAAYAAANAAANAATPPPTPPPTPPTPPATPPPTPPPRGRRKKSIRVGSYLLSRKRESYDRAFSCRLYDYRRFMLGAGEVCGPQVMCESGCTRALIS